MSGCTSCSSKGGCDSRKDDQRLVIAEVLRRVYLDQPPVWGRLDDEAAFAAGPTRREKKQLGRALAAALGAPTFFRPGEPADLCDYLYVLCLGRRPALVELLDGAGELPEELAGLPRGAGTPIDERYLRVAFSTLGRLVTVQEVAMTLVADEGALTLRERPRPGVYDPPLLPRVQRLLAELARHDLTHLDFGLLDRPVDGPPSLAYESRFGSPVAVANLLFFAAPPTTAREIVVAT